MLRGMGTGQIERKGYPMFTAILYKYDEATHNFEPYKSGEGESESEAIASATRNVPMGWGGHGRSERCLEALRSPQFQAEGAMFKVSQPVGTPLGNYMLVSGLTQAFPRDDS